MGSDQVSYSDALEAEAASWLSKDPLVFADKAQRERIRHYRLIKDLLLDKLDTHRMTVLEVGGGPMPVSDLIPFLGRVVIDPLTPLYAERFPCSDHKAMSAEDLPGSWNFNLVICTNALDHVEKPDVAILRIWHAVAPGGYLAILCAENNAITNPHPSHIHNLTAEWVHGYLDSDFETVWELTYAKDGYRYGWAPWNGKVGQPAFAMLMRRTTGYNS